MKKILKGLGKVGKAIGNATLEIIGNILYQGPR